MDYKYRTGFSVPGVPASEVAEELDRISELGPLTPQAVVESARDEQALLHPAFEWDDATAAHEHRLGQARTLLRGVCIVQGDSEPIPMHFHIRTEEGPRYERFNKIANNPDLYALALEELSGNVTAAQHAVKQLMAVGAGKLKGRKRKTVQAVSEHLEAAGEALAVL